MIGRATENPVAIPDTSVSRKHALVRRAGNGWAISDLGSGNGTLLNGEAIADETPLAEGDVITLGDSELVFSTGEAPPAAADDTGDTGEADQTLERPVPSGGRRPPVRTARTGGAPGARARPVRTSRMAEDPAAARQKRRKAFIALGGTLVVVLAALVGWKAIEAKKLKQLRAQQAEVREQQAGMADLFKDAKALVRQGKWTEARARLQEMQEADPEYEARQVANYLQLAQTEIPNQQLLAEAAAALQKGELGTAATALGKVKTTAQEAALKAAKDALDAKWAERLAEARTLAAAGSDLAKMEQVLAWTTDLLVVRPDDREAAELKKQAETAIFRIKNPTVAPPPPDTPWLEVNQRFKDGDAAGALSLAQACATKHAQCRTLEAQIKEFDAKSKRLEDLNETELIALYELDKKIAGGSSSDLSRPLRTQLVTKLFMKASQAKSARNWSTAIDYARRVLQADPGHVGAQALLKSGHDEAKDVYFRGYQLRETSPDEAMRLFKDVMSMTPADHEYHQKAKARLSELERQ